MTPPAHVVDWSHWNARIDFYELRRQGVIGGIGKATQGAAGVDDTFARRVSYARQASLLPGAYHFGTGGDGEVQARHFIGVSKFVPLVALDLERWQGPAMTRDEAEAFALAVSQARGVLPLIYGSADYLASLGVAPSSHLARCPLWLARWGNEPPVAPAPWKTWTLWQFTNAAQLGGATLDASTFNPEAGLRALWGV